MKKTNPILELRLWQQLQTVRVNEEFVNVFTNSREMGQCNGGRCELSPCVFYRYFQSSCQDNEGSKDRENLLSKPLSKEESFPVSRHDSRPPTRCGSRAGAERNGYRDFERFLKSFQACVLASRWSLRDCGIVAAERWPDC